MVVTYQTNVLKKNCDDEGAITRFGLPALGIADRPVAGVLEPPQARAEIA